MYGVIRSNFNPKLGVPDTSVQFEISRNPRSGLDRRMVNLLLCASPICCWLILSSIEVASLARENLEFEIWVKSYAWPYGYWSVVVYATHVTQVTEAEHLQCEHISVIETTVNHFLFCYVSHMHWYYHSEIKGTQNPAP